MHRVRFLFPLCLATLALSACFETKPDDLAGGGGIETTDGEIVAAAGSAGVAGVRVRMVPEAYRSVNPDSFPVALSATTDAAGHYAFRGLPPGRYNLEAWNPLDGTRFRLPAIDIAPDSPRTLAASALDRTGSLRLLWEPSHKGYLFVPGTSIAHRITATEIETSILVLDSLPKGILPPVYWARSISDTAGTRITDSIAIKPDSISEWSVFAAWAHHGIWEADPSALAAPTASDTEGFPLLLRLAAPGFDFSQAAPDGRDLRFSDPAGKALGFQIESWDAAAGRAAVWVRVPFNAIGTPAGSVLMHWGNPDADSRSSGGAVFGTSNGFAGAWHLGEAPNADPGGYADATGSGRNGTGVDIPAAPQVEGAIGSAQRLDGVSQRITITGSFPAARAPRCLSAWEKSSAPASEGHLVAYGSPAGLNAFGIWNDAGTWTAWHWGPPPYDMPSSARADTSWHLVAVDYDGATTRFYYDGEVVAVGARALATTPNGFTIGSSFTPDRFWNGLVDEVEAAQVSRPEAWLKLAFETQKPGSSAFRLRLLR